MTPIYKLLIFTSYVITVLSQYISKENVVFNKIIVSQVSGKGFVTRLLYIGSDYETFYLSNFNVRENRMYSQMYYQEPTQYVPYDSISVNKQQVLNNNINGYTFYFLPGREFEFLRRIEGSKDKLAEFFPNQFETSQKSNKTIVQMFEEVFYDIKNKFEKLLESRF